MSNMGEVITERERALQVLDLLVRENEYRLHVFRDLEVKNLDEYNKKNQAESLSYRGVHR